MSLRQLVLFTSAYPSLQGESSFLEPELPHLLHHFDRIVLVPERALPPYSQLPSGVEMDLSYAGYVPPQSFTETAMRALACPETYAEIRRNPHVLRNRSMLKSLLSFVARASKTRSWLRAFLKATDLPPSGVVMLYTYWLDQATLGLSLDGRPYTRVVSRAHGYDVYEERRQPPYIPCRHTSLHKIDRLLVVSEHARDHLLARYPTAASRVEVCRLGVPDPCALSSRSSDGAFRLMSCSHLSDLKRVGLLLEGLCRLAEEHPEVSFLWTHFGTGPLEGPIKARTRVTPSNLRTDLKGWQPNRTVMGHYREEAVDLFLSASSSEGVPVSIMEAQSHGVPVLATAVGGCPELVTSREGALLSRDPTPVEIARRAWALLTDPALDARREAARHRWSQSYDAQRNFSMFARTLARLCSEPPNPARLS